MLGKIQQHNDGEYSSWVLVHTVMNGFTVWQEESCTAVNSGLAHELSGKKKTSPGMMHECTVYVMDSWYKTALC